MTSQRLRVAVLDDYQDLSKDVVIQLRSEADISVFQDTILPSQDMEALVQRLQPYQVISTMRERTPFPSELIARLPSLEILLTTGMHNRGIDLEACRAKGIIVAGTPAAPLPSGAPSDLTATVQHTWALILALVDNIPRDQGLVTSGSWARASPLNTYIGGKTIGLLGLGKLGTGVARIAKLAFGMRVIAWSENLTQDKADETAGSLGFEARTFESVSKAELFKQSDILSIHLVLSERSRGIV